MDIKQAVRLTNIIESSSPPAYEIFKLETVGGKLARFHQWTNGKQVEAAFKITRLGFDTSYYFLFIDWHQNDNYYLVIYTHDKKTTVAEIQQVKEIDGTLKLVWMYKPFKRDGKNDVRKAYFKQMFGSTTVQIELPSSSHDIEDFFNQLFTLCRNRVKADRIVDVFDFEQ